MNTKKIYWAGDSTVKKNNISTYPQTGIGQMLPMYLKNEVTICNHAENARSTKSFIAEGRLDAILTELNAGDYLFIQFGHNDWNEKPERHTVAFGDYQDNLRFFINKAREKGAFPVLITPVYMREYDESGVLKEKVHFDYPDAMLAVGKETNTPCIDLCQKSYEAIKNAGSEFSKNWFMNLPADLYRTAPDGKVDNAHLRYEGAVVMAGLVAEGLYELGEHYRELLISTEHTPVCIYAKNQ
ncbi:MAG: rhamnogalacturonan acetylesterase [Lachnospiraceae bacterium]|nr:rhamnogalacturonan acetylesterase [Lachnospiraceae bacterium]